MECFKCTAISENGQNESVYSETAYFEMGLLEPEETVDTESRKPAQFLHLSFAAKGNVKKQDSMKLPMVFMKVS